MNAKYSDEIIEILVEMDKEQRMIEAEIHLGSWLFHEVLEERQIPPSAIQNIPVTKTTEEISMSEKPQSKFYEEKIKAFEDGGSIYYESWDLDEDEVMIINLDCIQNGHPKLRDPRGIKRYRFEKTERDVVQCSNCGKTDRLAVREVVQNAEGLPFCSVECLNEHAN